MNRAGWRGARIALVLLAVIAPGLAWGGWVWWNARSCRKILADSRNDIATGHPGRAAQRLRNLLSWKPDSDEAAYLLGNCEKLRGLPQAAAAAWTRVSPGSPFAPQAIQSRLEMDLASGRLAAAEQLARGALVNPRIDGSRLALFLGLMYARQGRGEEAARLIETIWNRLVQRGQANWERAISLARLHIRLRLDPPPLEAVRAFLDQAAGRAPDDDRVWLGRANLAVRAGRYDEADRLLDVCLKLRPEDVPVWRVRLRWALAANRVDAAREAAHHLPAAESSPAQAHVLASWLAARQGDVEKEQRALERVLAVDPGDMAARGRLIELAVKNGKPERAAELRGEQAEMEMLQDRYRALAERNQPFRDAAEMAGLAEKLGQPFEARTFLTVAVAVDLERHDLRDKLVWLNQEAVAESRPGRTLAEILKL
jgi:enediyne biosynthesis protein E4